MVCYPVLMFLVSDEVDSYDIGWLLIGLILVNIAINVAIMMILTGLKIREKYRRRKAKIAWVIKNEKKEI